MKKSNSYLEGDVKKILFSNSITMIFGVSASFAFNFIDTLFVAKLGTLELAAITFTFPIVFIVIGISMGIGIGVSSIVSRAYGANDLDKVKRITKDSMFFSFLIALAFVLISFIFFEDIFILMGAEEKTLPYIKDFMFIWYFGVVFIAISIIGNSVFRALGNTKESSMIMVVSAITNLILDPIFIFGYSFIPFMGIKGAALATLIGRFLSFVITLYLLNKKYQLLDFTFPKFHTFKESIKEVMYIGLPSALTNILVPLGMAIVISLVSKYGQVAVGAIGATGRIEMLTVSVFIALGSVLGPFIGQNWGANNKLRIISALKISYIFCFIWGIIVYLLFLIFKHEIAIFVKDDNQTVEYMTLILGISPMAICFKGVIMISSTTLNILKKPLIASLITIFQMFVVFIPMAYLLSSYYGFNGILYSSVLSSVIVSFGAFYFLRKNVRLL